MQRILEEFSDRDQEIIAEFATALLGSDDGYGRSMSEEDVIYRIFDRSYGFPNSNLCWITREGKVYSCQWAGHARLARDLGTTEENLEKQGWTKVTVSGVYCMFKKTAAQIRVLKKMDMYSEDNVVMPTWRPTNENS
jgi:hypothetical protein